MTSLLTQMYATEQVNPPNNPNNQMTGILTGAQASRIAAMQQTGMFPPVPPPLAARLDAIEAKLEAILAILTNVKQAKPTEAEIACAVKAPREEQGNALLKAIREASR